MTRDLGFSLSWLTLIRLPFLTNQLHWGPYLNRTLCTVLNKVIIWDDVCISAKYSRKERNNTDKKLNIYNQYIMYSTKEFLIREVLSFSARSIDNILPIFCHFFYLFRIRLQIRLGESQRQMLHVFKDGRNLGRGHSKSDL